MFEKTIDKIRNACYNRVYPKGNERKEVQKNENFKKHLELVCVLAYGKGRIGKRNG